MRKPLFFLFIIMFTNHLYGQVYPTFGPEKQVTISGLTFDAMEPFITNNDSVLYFNSLNAGGNTNLYYATKINDTTFLYKGLVDGCYDITPGHLDAVASEDINGHFYWVSLRNYPIEFENLHTGLNIDASITNISRVYGDINIYTIGWIIMDAAITPSGDQLIYCNAYFDLETESCGPGIPCFAQMGIATKENDSTFNKLDNSDLLLNNVNDTAYLIYAPQLSENGLELYFTRLLKGHYETEICVSVRNAVDESFSTPYVIHTNGLMVPEGPSISNNYNKLYYHQKGADGLFHIYMRNRMPLLSIISSPLNNNFLITPNPAQQVIQIQNRSTETIESVLIYSISGQLILNQAYKTYYDISNFQNGIYQMVLKTNSNIYPFVFCIQH